MNMIALILINFFILGNSYAFVPCLDSIKTLPPNLYDSIFDVSHVLGNKDQMGIETHGSCGQDGRMAPPDISNQFEKPAVYVIDMDRHNQDLLNVVNSYVALAIYQETVTFFAMKKLTPGNISRLCLSFTPQGHRARATLLYKLVRDHRGFIQPGSKSSCD